MPRPLNQLTASEAAAQIAAGTLTSERLVEACLERIAARDKTVQAWIHVDPDKALAEARQRDSQSAKGPLHGVPIGIKDIIDTADLPTCYGSPIYAGHRPVADAACVALARAAGAVILGKTVTTEFATYTPGKTVNPHNSAHTPGGSSSGSAAAVADSMVPLAFGTQTAASVIRPASFCGTVAYKSTCGEFALQGVKLLGQSLDSLGVFARSVADCQLVRAALVDAKPTPGAQRRPPRIGLFRTPQWDDADVDSQRAVESAVAELGKAGATVDEVPIREPFDKLVDLHNQVLCFEVARALAYEYENHRDRMSERLISIVTAGRAVTYESYSQALLQRNRCRQMLTDLFISYDALLAPSAPGEAPKGLESTGNPLFGRIWSLLQAPSVNLPGHTGRNKLPVGVQVIGAFGQDDRLIAVAQWMEKRIA
ncbi:MAG: amidase [Alphaproteobacteria bacterium]|nr:amidase [Alphaproteobacteria bacterium]